MYYDRKVKYLDYYERGERVRGGGHAKLEARDGRLRLELKLQAAVGSAGGYRGNRDLL